MGFWETRFRFASSLLTGILVEIIAQQYYVTCYLASLSKTIREYQLTVVNLIYYFKFINT